MNKTNNLGLVLYESNDKFAITASENSLNNSMEIIDSSIAEVNSKINTIASSGVKRKIVDMLPDIGLAENNVIYMVGCDLKPISTKEIPTYVNHTNGAIYGMKSYKSYHTSEWSISFTVE